MRNKAKKEEKSYRPGEVMTMFESLKKDIGLIAEGHGGLVKKIDDLSERVDKNHRDLTGRIDGLSGSVNERFDAVDRRFDGIDANLKVALEYLFRIDEEIQDIKTGIKELKDSIKGKAEKEKVLQMEKRLEMLEKEFMLYKKRALANRS